MTPLMVTPSRFGPRASRDIEAAQEPSCVLTGLSVPECSCRRCHEKQVLRFRPELLSVGPAHLAAA
jgi:hypothetical protein